jgi:hypothetical protein
MQDLSSDLNDVMSYLNRLHSYPFDPDIDGDFVIELFNDFPDIDTLEQIKSFRWYHNGNPVANTKNIRLAIRRWLSNAKVRPYEPF